MASFIMHEMRPSLSKIYQRYKNITVHTVRKQKNLVFWLVFFSFDEFFVKADLVVF